MPSSHRGRGGSSPMTPYRLSEQPCNGRDYHERYPRRKRACGGEPDQREDEDDREQLHRNAVSLYPSALRSRVMDARRVEQSSGDDREDDAEGDDRAEGSASERVDEVCESASNASASSGEPCSSGSASDRVAIDP